MWMGEIVHHTIENSLKQYQLQRQLPTEQFLTQITERMRREFRESREKGYRKRPGKVLGLYEHEYGRNISDEKWKTLHDTARRCFTNFANIIFPERVRPVPVENWKLIETMQTFNFEETSVYVKIDFAYMTYSNDSERAFDGSDSLRPEKRSERSGSVRPDGGHGGRAGSPTIHIIDWKTGKSEDVDNEIQLDCYGLFSRDHFNVPTESIETVECNVNLVKETVRPMIEAKVDFAKHYLRNSIAAMKKALAEPDKNLAREEDFPFTDNERTCDWCFFKKICPKWA